MAKKTLPQLSICQNCETPTPGKFCPECGQDSRDHRVSMRLLLFGIWNDLFTFDSRFFRSFIPLLFVPGKLTVEYIVGKRVRYIPPVRLYLFVSILFFFLISVKITAHRRSDGAEEVVSGPGLMLVDSFATRPANVDSLRTVLRNLAAEMEEAETLAEGMPAGIELDIEDRVDNGLPAGMDMAHLDSLAAAGVEEIDLPQRRPPGYLNSTIFGRKFYLRNDYLISAVLSVAPKGMFLLLPIFAGLLALIYIRGRRLFIEHLVFSLHYHSLLFLLFALVALSSWWPGIPIAILGFHVYLFFAMKRVYAQGWRKTWLKHFLLTSAYNLVFTITLAGTFAGSVLLILGAEEHPRFFGWLLG